MNTALFLLRTIEIGLAVADLEMLSVGMVYDIFTEKSFDENGYIRAARQKDFDNF